MIAGLPVVLADGVDPKDASPGIGAFVTFLILALVIILLAWSFTRHQRRIRANAAREAEQAEREAAQREAAEPAAREAQGTAASGSGSPDADAGPDGAAGPRPQVPEQDETPGLRSDPSAAGDAEDDGGGQR